MSLTNKEKLWWIAHDIIEMFEKDFGPFKGIALKIAYEYIQDMPESQAETLIIKIKAIIETSDKNDKKKK